MNPNFEWIPVTHMACGGQGCVNCRDGEELIYINTSEEQTA